MQPVPISQHIVIEMKELLAAAFLFIHHLLATIQYGNSGLDLGCQRADTDWMSKLIYNKSFQDVCCPSSDLPRPFKVNQIHIGLTGGTVDPEVEGLMEYLEHIVNEAAQCNSTVHPRPVPEYLIALFGSLMEINNDTQVLPYHQICVHTSINANTKDAVFNTQEHLVSNNSIVAIMDINSRRVSKILHPIILPFSIPLIHFPEDIKSYSLSELLESLSPHKEETHDENIFDFNITPKVLDLFVAIESLAEYYGWKRMGLLISDDHMHHVIEFCTSTIDLNHTRLFTAQYNDGHLFHDIKHLLEREIRVFAYIGDIYHYLKMILEASEFNMVNQWTIWIYLYSEVHFPEDFSDPWCGFSEEDVDKLMRLLPGTLQLGIGKGLAAEYNNFSNNFHSLAEEAVNNNGNYEKNSLYTQTSYVSDVLKAIAAALDNTIRKKEKAFNLHGLKITVDANDRQKLAHELSVISGIHGTTGPISFKNNGHRKVLLFDVRNFAPVQNSSWKLFTPVVLMKDGSNTQLTFYDQNGRPSKESTIVFADGSTKSPPYKPERRFRRNANQLIIINVLIIVAFLFIATLFIIYIYTEDQKLLCLLNKSVFTMEDITPSTGLISMNFSSLQYSDEKLAKLKESNTVVLMKPGIFNQSLLTKSVEIEINHLKNLNHPNVAIMCGCLLDIKKQAFLYEFGFRGTLHRIVEDSEMDLDWIFKISFIMDIAEGMRYLHSRRVVHGRLSTKSCLVDNQWTIKLQDYGLLDLHKITDEKKRRNAKKALQAEGICWPPEVFKNKEFCCKLTNEMDIFHFGNIIENIEKKNWTNVHDIYEETSDIYAKLKGMDEKPMIKELNSSQKKLCYEQLITDKVINIKDQCQVATPQTRPSFEVLTRSLKKISSLLTESGDSVDMLQVYSQRLEERLHCIGGQLEDEREHWFNRFQSFIPKCMIDQVINEGKLLPIQCHQKVIAMIEIMNIEDIFDSLELSDFKQLLMLMNGSVEAVISMNGMSKYSASGTTWLIASDSGPCDEGFVSGAQALFSIFEYFRTHGIHKKVYVATRAVLIDGSLTAGLVDQKLFCFGKGMTRAEEMLNQSRDGCIVTLLPLAEKIIELKQEWKCEFNSTIVEINKKPTNLAWLMKPSDNASKQYVSGAKSINTSLSHSASQIPRHQGSFRERRSKTFHMRNHASFK